MDCSHRYEQNTLILQISNTKLTHSKYVKHKIHFVRVFQIQNTKYEFHDTFSISQIRFSLNFNK